MCYLQGNVCYYLKVTVFYEMLFLWEQVLHNFSINRNNNSCKKCLMEPIIAELVFIWQQKYQCCY